MPVKLTYVPIVQVQQEFIIIIIIITLRNLGC